MNVKGEIMDRELIADVVRHIIDKYKTDGMRSDDHTVEQVVTNYVAEKRAQKKPSPNNQLTEELAKAVWCHAQKRPLSWTLESMKRVIGKCVNAYSSKHCNRRLATVNDEKNL